MNRHAKPYSVVIILRTMFPAWAHKYVHAYKSNKCQLFTEYLNAHCGLSVKVVDAVHLKLRSMFAYVPKPDCSAVLYNDLNRRMMVRFIKVNIRNSTNCHTDRMELYKDRHENGNPLVGKD